MWSVMQNRPILSSNIEHVLFTTIKSANFLDIGHHGDYSAVGDEYLL